MSMTQDIIKPKIEYPDWLPDEIKQVFIDHVDEYSKDKHHCPKAQPTPEQIQNYEGAPELPVQRPHIYEPKTNPEEDEYYTKYKTKYKSDIKYIDTWPGFLEDVDFLKRAFIWDVTEQAWLSLYKESPDKAVSFAKALLRFNSDFKTEVVTQKNFQQEKEEYIKIFKKASQLLDKINNYNEMYGGYVEQGSYDDLNASLNNFLSSVPDAVRDFNNYVKESSDIKTSELAVGREHNSKKGKAVYFVRRISFFFIQEYGQPKSLYVADFIYALFEFDYCENDIIKTSKNVKNILKHEDSTK